MSATRKFTFRVSTVMGVRDISFALPSAAMIASVSPWFDREWLFRSRSNRASFGQQLHG